jgi:adenylosuccinate synthase
MAVTVVVGGQFGSEGKGKVALELAREQQAAAVIRVGGPNSGHTAIDNAQRIWQLRQLPTAALVNDVYCILPAGALIDPKVFLAEVSLLQLTPERVLIDPNAMVITAGDRETEARWDLVRTIGSTGSGTGAAVARRISRTQPDALASSSPPLARFIQPTAPFVSGLLRQGRRVVVEGTQGFGLSVFHTPEYPKATSRDTTAAACLSEAGISPRYVDDVTLVIRALPIRVAGDSGRLPNETTWEMIAEEASLPRGWHELSTVTGKKRRIGRFDPEIVRRAIEVNKPDRIVMNHVDLVDPECRRGVLTSRALALTKSIQDQLSMPINWIGHSPTGFIKLR